MGSTSATVTTNACELTCAGGGTGAGHRMGKRRDYREGNDEDEEDESAWE